ncbi:Pycsar system effector family protein [Gelidibacter salicanalis]|uniref:HD domain-containing protein n=1 Tax=Gelidibacter salicanalis TaxID=291193 RepID=A0A934NJ82_9FLAO|nr:Pycsar system effector family protein [Gelidibacter salicanalis]MBJ7882163.1 HD domain-containing protein [Gelidibacter salicanalis]
MTDIIKNTEDFVFNLFKEELPNTFLYHNFTHTKRVLKSTKEIIQNLDITTEQSTILQLAALLHDTGYTKLRDGHEEESVKIATAFLETQQVDQTIINAVNECIMATKFKGTPKNELERVIRDADASHFGKSYFNEASEFLRKELELQNVRKYSPSEWLAENIEVLSQNHQFYTDYALKNWQIQKEDNLAELIKSSKKEKKRRQKEKMKAQLKAKAKDASPERAIQSFYRTALRNHIKLSDIADTKANILLSVNAIIISLMLSTLFSKFDNPSNQFLIVPTIILMLSSITSMILSIIATRPNITSGEFTKEDVENRKVNLTFFGNFHKMKLEDFEWAINELLKDKDYVYSSLTKDLYFLGKVLDRKYRILRVTYTIFMTGMIISVIAFAISFKFSPAADLDEVLKTEKKAMNLIELRQDRSQNYYV